MSSGTVNSTRSGSTDARPPRERNFWRAYRRALTNSTGVMLAYRSNLLFFFLFETFFLISSFLGAGLGVSLAGGSINGWTRDQIFALTAINGVSHQFFICFFISPLFNMPEYIWNGRMDYVLQKPLHPLLGLMVTSEIVISNLPNLFINVGIAAWFIASTAPASAAHASSAPVWLLFAALTVLGVAVRYALALFCMTPSFYAERMIQGEDGFWSIVGTGRFPTTVFPRVVERILLYVIPLSMMAAVPAGYLFERLDATQAALAGVSSLGFLGVSLLFFNRALKSYQSVNSGM
ncbi:hypothetical protein EBZ80_00575 [bacterium]|nr:hypothetical protein [bacterium]